MEIVIFNTESTEKELDKLLNSLDNTFGPMESGGYEVRYAIRKKEDIKNGFIIFTFKELDVAPRRTFHMAIKENKIWTYSIAGTIFEALRTKSIKFSVNYTEKSPITLPVNP